MRLLALLPLSALPLAAQACMENLSVEVGASWIHIYGEASAVGTETKWHTRYDRTPSPTGGFVTPDRTSGHATRVERYDNIVNVGPGTKVYFAPEVTADDGTTWFSVLSCDASLCPAGAGPQADTDIVCEDVGGVLYPTVTTPAASGIDEPELPVHTRTLEQAQARPTLTGSVFDIAPDCSDLQSKINSAAAADAALNHEVRIPPGTVCRAEMESLTNYSLPSKADSGGWVTILCDFDAGHAIPPGVQYSPPLVGAAACRIQVNRDLVGTNGPTGTNGALIRPGCFGSACSSGWSFEGIIFEPGDWRDQGVREIAVDSTGSGSSDITLVSAAGTTLCAQCDLTYALPGITGAGTGSDIYARGQNPTNAFGGGGTTINLNGGIDFVGSYSGGGYVSMPLAFEIDSCTSAAPSVCTLARPHRMIPYVARSISGDIASGVVTLDSGHGLTLRSYVAVSGNSACDGLYEISGQTSTTVTLLNSSCSGTGGTIRRLHTGLLFDLVGTGASALTGVWPIDFTAADAVTVVGSDLAGLTITDGGFAPQTAITMSRYLDFQSTKRWRVDRCLFLGGGFPWRWRGALSLGTHGDGTVTNSYAKGFGFWQPLSEERGILDQAQISAGGSTAIIFGGNAPIDIQVYNFTCEDCQGFVRLLADISSLRPATDMTWKKIFNVERRDSKPGHSQAVRRLGYLTGHDFEEKNWKRILIDGWYSSNHKVVRTGNEFAIYGSCHQSASGDNSRCEDFTIRNVYLRNVGTSFGFFINSLTPTFYWGPIVRTAIDNVLIDGQPWRASNSSATGQTLELQGPFTASNGAAIQLWGPITSFSARRMTGRRLDSGSTISPILTIRNAAGGVQVAKSLFAHAGTSTQGVFMLDAGGSGETGWLSFANDVGQPDPLSYFGGPDEDYVGIQPCLTATNGATPDFTSANNAFTNAASAFGCSDCTQWNVTVAGADSQSCATREAAVFNEDLTAKGDFAGLGYDKAELYEALGFGVAVTVATATGQIAYTVPSGTPACTVDHSASATYATHTRLTDSGSGTSRAVTASGYTSGQTVHYRVLCPGLQGVWGSFVR